VYLGPNLRHGHPWLYAVKADGNTCDRIYLVKRRSTAEAFAIMRRYLDEVDPPRLRLVKTSPAPPAEPFAGQELTALQYDLQRWKRNPARWPRLR